MITPTTYRKFFTRTHVEDEEDRITIAVMGGSITASIGSALRDKMISDRIAVQKMLQRAIRIAETKGVRVHGCEAQLREILKSDRHSPEQIHRARHALDWLETKP